MMNLEELNEWKDCARRGLEREIERLREKEEEMGDYMRALEATESLLSEVESLRGRLEECVAENASLNAALEDKCSEAASLRIEVERKQAEVERKQAEVERKQAEVERLQLCRGLPSAEEKPMEIHNHFERGSSAQVFNDKVTGKFSKIRKWKQHEKREKRLRLENRRMS